MKIPLVNKNGSPLNRVIAVYDDDSDLGMNVSDFMGDDCHEEFKKWLTRNGMGIDEEGFGLAYAAFSAGFNSGVNAR